MNNTEIIEEMRRTSKKRVEVRQLLVDQGSDKQIAEDVFRAVVDVCTDLMLHGPDGSVGRMYQNWSVIPGFVLSMGIDIIPESEAEKEDM